MLATLLTLWNVMLGQPHQPDDVEDLGRWVSGLFRVIQQPHLVEEETTAAATRTAYSSVTSQAADNVVNTTAAGNRGKRLEQHQQTSLAAVASSSQHDEDEDDDVMDGGGEGEAVSVSQMRAVFESFKTPTPHTPSPFSSSTSLSSPSPFNDRSVSSSPAPHHVVHHNNHHNQQHPHHSNGSLHHGPSDDSLSDYKKMQNSISKMGDKFADVVCWLGRYIEQDEEKQVLTGTANPFLAKLRMRHKLELIARLESTAADMEKNIDNMKERLANKQLTKSTVGEKYTGRLIRNAEDAGRADDERKRIDRECSSLQTRIKETERQLGELMDSIETMQTEIQNAYEQFNWEANGHHTDSAGRAINGQNGGGDHGFHTSEEDDDEDINDTLSTEDLPDWTKKAKEKAKAWKNRSELLH